MPALGGMEHEFTMRKTELLVLDELEWSPSVLGRDMRWVMNPARCARLLQAMDDAGVLEWTPVKSINQLKGVLSKGIRAMRVADRILGDADVIAYPEVAPAVHISEKITPLRFGGDTKLAVDYKMSMVDGYVEARRNDADGMFQETQAALLDIAGDDLASKH